MLSPGSSGLPGWAVWVAFVVVVAAAVGVRVYDLGGPCFDCDELYAVRIQGASPKNVAGVMVRDGFHSIHPPLMSVPFLLWGSAFGYSEAAIRGLSAVAGVVAVAALFALGHQLGRQWAGVFAAALLAVNPFHITYSAEARQYSLLVALLSVANLLYVLAWKKGTRGWLIGYYLIAAWAAFTHYFAVPVLIGHAAFAGWHAIRGTDKAVARRLFLAVAFAGLPYLAWLPVMRAQTKSGLEYLAPLTPAGMADSLADLFGVRGWGSEVGWMLVGAVVLLAVAGVWAAWRVRVPATGPTKRLVPGWLGVVVFLLAAAGTAGLIVAFPRWIEPQARQAIEAYGYSNAEADAEIALLRRTGFLLAGCGAVVGVVLFAWGRVEKATPTPSAGQFPTGAFLATSLVVPAVVVAAFGLVGVPFHQTRNLVVFLPAVYASIGFGLDRVANRPVGGIAAVVVIVGLAAAASRYDAIGRVVGWGGTKLGLNTIDWRGVRTELESRPPAGTVVLVNRPATDPGTYYLQSFNPTRVPADAVDLPARVAFVHLLDNEYSERVLSTLRARGLLARTASGDGWELWQTQE